MDSGIFFAQPFAQQGDRDAIPLEAQPSNAVSFTTGYTLDYTLNIVTDPRAKSIERTKQNYLFWALSAVIGQMQRSGVPEWVAPADNGGVALSYPKGARVWSGGKFYVSQIANNNRNLTDTTAWASGVMAYATNAEALTGTAVDLLLTPATLKYVLANTTIGQAASTTIAGVSRYATVAETTAGVVATAAVTPSSLKPIMDTKAGNVAPRIMGPLTVVQPAPGARTVEFVRPGAGGVTGWALAGQPDGGMDLYAYDDAGTNGQAAIRFGAFVTPSTARTTTVPGQLSATTISATGGRVAASVTATEAASSTVRFATASEINAGTDAGVAVSAKNFRDYATANLATRVAPQFYGDAKFNAVQWVRDDRIARYNMGTNAALEWRWDAYSETGAFANNIMVVPHAAGGTIAIARPLGVTGAVTASVTATEAASSTVRFATTSEINATTPSAGLAVSASGLRNYALASLAPNSNPTFIGDVATRSDGLRHFSVRNAAGQQRFSLGLNPATDLQLSAFDSGTGAFANVVFAVGQTGPLNLSRALTVAGAVSASFLASETTSSTTRLATAAEMTAGNAGVAASPSRIQGWANGAFPPINNPIFTGSVRVPSGDSGIAWRATNGANRFYTNAELNGYDLAIAGCKDNGDYNRICMTINRLTGVVGVDTLAATTLLSAPTIRNTSRRDKKRLFGNIGGRDALDILSQIPAYWGDWKPGVLDPAAENLTRPFWIADEVEQYLPGIVGKDDDGEAGSVGYHEAVPLLAAGLSDVDARLLALTEMVRDMAGQNAALRAELDELKGK